MHITELRLSGFKSFVDPVRAPIEAGLTGIVGPNGCGKSNLLEAVRWVMGAASAKSMRAEDMDDVIFAGSGGRPAREHAEVALVLADALGKGPGALANEDVLEVSRRIRREAGSTYRINGKEVRAKDVQLLFADAATGANSPALVRQGQVSELINAKPENRRRIIEDAAGVAGLHARRHEADLKLRAAEANLTRLDEILIEIEAQALSLKKQARQAERYRGLAQTLRETEALLLHRRWSEARAHAEALEAERRAAERTVAETAERASALARAAELAHEALAPAREQELIASAVLRRLEGVRVGLERDLAEAEAAIARTDDDLARNRAETERLEHLRSDALAALARLESESATLGANDAQHAATALAEARTRETIAAEARAQSEAAYEALAAEAASARARADALRQAASAAKARLDRIDERLALLSRQIQDDADIAALETRAAEASQAAIAAQAVSDAARARLAEAETALKRAEKAGDAAWAPYRAAESAARQLEAEVKALEKLSPPEGQRFPPVLAAIDAEPGFERALAAALGDDLDASLSADAPLRWTGAKAPAVTLPEDAQALADHVKAPPALAARLALVGLVQREQGAALQKKAGPGVRLVSRQGDLWRWDGFTRAAEAPAPAAAKLEHKTRLAAARAESAAAGETFARLKHAWDDAHAARKQAEDHARAARLEAPKRAAEAAQAEAARERLEQDLARRRERRAEWEAQRQALADERDGAALDLQSASGADAGQAPSEADLSAARAAMQEARAAAADAQAARQGLDRESAARAQRRTAIIAETTQWRARAADSETRLKGLTKEREGVEARRAQSLAAPQTAQNKLEQLAEEAEGAERRRQEAADAAARAETAARQAQTEAHAAEAAHAKAREARASLEAQAEGARARLAEIGEYAQAQTGRPPEALIGLAGALAASPLAVGPIPDIEKRLERLRGERDAAGPVNLRAEEELAETETRMKTLAAEKDDVAQGIAKLRRGVNALNAEGRERLLKAFDIVNGQFGQLFETLFEGGQAALKLTESEDPLDAGLEIFAQPPGKKLSTLSLMSGGEQALTATALIFAVFLANPAPLCVLDEVDAPLDDANVDRFCRLLEEMKKRTATRFIVITHNPVTMSRMDRLFGVTMPEQGASQLVSVDLAKAQALAGVA